MIRSIFFFFNDTATTEIYTLSLHDALPISRENHSVPRLVGGVRVRHQEHSVCAHRSQAHIQNVLDRKSTRLNSSHTVISYAVFCLEKKDSESRGEYRSRGSLAHIVRGPLRT